MIKAIDTWIPKDVFDEFRSQFDTDREAIDFLTLTIEKRIRSKKRLIKKDLLKSINHERVTIPMQDYLIPYFNEYILSKGMTKQEFIVKLMKSKKV